MGWQTYVVNQTGQDVWCFWATVPGVGDFPGWDMVNFHVPAGHSCAANRAGLCLFGFGAMFAPYPPPAGLNSPLGTPSIPPGQLTPGGGTGGPLSPVVTNPQDPNILGRNLNGVPLLWANYDSSQGNACSHWGFRLVKSTTEYQHNLSSVGWPTTTWTYPAPLPMVAESQNWISGSGMFAAYPASTSGCPGQ